MLVLTRRLMEKLYIGDDICVTVVRLEGGQVRLGVEAPRDVPIVRAELRREPTASSAPRNGVDGRDAITTTPPASVPGTGSPRLGRSR